jgi:hypothetical protein
MTQYPIEEFDKNGFCVIPSLFSKQEIEGIGEAFDKLEDEQIKSGKVVRDHESAIFLSGDVLGSEAYKEFNYLLFNSKILNASRALLGENISYFGESNMQSGIGLRGFHKDNRESDREDPDGADWVGEYPLIRIAIYLHDSDLYSGGIKLVRGSHRKATSYFKTGGVNVSSVRGDVVIWKLTTTHSGNPVRLKGIPNLSLHPGIEAKIPPMFHKHNPRRRRAIFIVVGAPSDHLNRYTEYYGSRPDNQLFLRNNGKSDHLSKLAKDNNVELLFPSVDYGSDFIKQPKN